MRDLTIYGIKPQKRVVWDATTPVLVEETLKKGLGQLAHKGPLVVDTTPYTGRSPKDKYIVRDASVESEVWWGEVNHPFEVEAFERLASRVAEHLSARELYVQDLYAGHDPNHNLGVRVITESPWHALFARNLFILPRVFFQADVIEPFVPGITVLHAPSYKAVPERDGTRSQVFVILDLKKRLILIGGTAYAGEIKKAVFSFLNYLMPKSGVLSMHCSANVGAKGDTALFFGLSGTGKTTLSADPDRRLIGDDEHGWGDFGVFNFEGGSYAKVIDLAEEKEPLIWEATNQFETILENVVLNPESRRVEWSDASKTENTRSAYPLAHIKNREPSGRGDHPKNIFFLSADAFGVLPPIAKLTAEQAMYYFLSGYTAKVAGTERGITEPVATFSAAFGEPFLPLAPSVYAKLLGEKIKAHKPQVWLINTGWTGGPYGVGHRIELKYTRLMLKAALEGALENVPYRKDPVFGLEVPTQVPGVPSEVLDPRATWEDPNAYDASAKKLAAMFRENFRRYEGEVDPEVRAAGPLS